MSKIANMSRAKLRGVIRDLEQRLMLTRQTLAAERAASSPTALNQRMLEWVQRPVGMPLRNYEDR